MLGAAWPPEGECWSEAAALPEAAEARDEPAATNAASDTLYIALPFGMDLHAASLIFGQYGEVARMEMVPNDELIVAVVYYDVRAAAAALGELDQESVGCRCWLADMRGDRLVSVPDPASVDFQALEGAVAAAWPLYAPPPPRARGAACGEAVALALELYDVREAERLREALQATSFSADPGGSCDSSSLSSGLQRRLLELGPRKRQQQQRLSALALRPVPAFVLPTHVMAETAIVEEEKATASIILISGLPNLMATEPFLEAFLQQAGFGASGAEAGGDSGDGGTAPDAVEAWRGRPCGEALLYFAGRTVVAERCFRHFNGCLKWDASGAVVSARLVSAEEALAALAEHGNAASVMAPLLSSLLPTAPTVEPGLPKKVDLGPPRKSPARWAAVSIGEESTEAGPSEIGDGHEEVCEDAPW